MDDRPRGSHRATELGLQTVSLAFLCPSRVKRHGRGQVRRGLAQSDAQQGDINCRVVSGGAVRRYTIRGPDRAGTGAACQLLGAKPLGERPLGNAVLPSV